MKEEKFNSLAEECLGGSHFPQILSSSLKAGHAKDEANGMLPQIDKGGLKLFPIKQKSPVGILVRG